MDEHALAQQLQAMAHDERQRLFKNVFGTLEGQKALMIILVQVGKVAEVRINPQGDHRAYLDGKRDAALEIMNLAGFSPFNLALRLLELPALPQLKDLEHETFDDINGAARAGRRGGRGRRSGGKSAIRAGDITTGGGFAGD